MSGVTIRTGFFALACALAWALCNVSLACLSVGTEVFLFVTRIIPIANTVGIRRASASTRIVTARLLVAWACEITHDITGIAGVSIPICIESARWKVIHWVLA